MHDYNLTVLTPGYIKTIQDKKLSLIQSINLAWLGIQLASKSVWTIERDENDVVIYGDSTGFIPVMVNGVRVSLYRPELVHGFGSSVQSSPLLYPPTTHVSLNQVLAEHCDLVLEIDDKANNPVFIPVSKSDTTLSIFKSVLAALCQIWPIKAELRLQINADLDTIENLRLE